MSFDDGKFFHLSTMGKRVLVPRTLVGTIVAMYHELEVFGHSGVLPTMALISATAFVASPTLRRALHLKSFALCLPDIRLGVPDYILSCDVCQAAKSRRVHTARQHRPLPVPATNSHSVSVNWFSGLPSTTRGHDAINIGVDRFSKRGMFFPCRKDMTSDDLVYVFLREVIRLKGCPPKIVSDRDKLFDSKAWKELA